MALFDKFKKVIQGDQEAVPDKKNQMPSSIENITLETGHFQPELLIRTHMEHVYATWPNNPQSQWAHDFCQKYIINRMEFICFLAGEKMKETQKDGKRHNTTIFDNEVCFKISVFSNSIPEVKRIYYNSGYFEYLDVALRNSRDGNPNCHFMHFQFFKSSFNYLFQFTLFPNRNILPFNPIYVMPTDILSEDERKKMGL